MNTFQKYLSALNLPDQKSHKGQNGKLLLIGGSHLFHAASKWSLDIASKFVDMVFYASVPSNNQLVKEAKSGFWNGIVVSRTDMEDYLEESDAILIGPGMERSEFKKEWADPDIFDGLSDQEWQSATQKIVNYLLKKYPQKRWVIDAGALQMVNPALLNQNCLCTPHHKEFVDLYARVMKKQAAANIGEAAQELSKATNGAAYLVKGEVDFFVQGDSVVEIPGGNAGMTKGGTGDVLAGLVAALRTNYEVDISAVVGSYINKKAGEELWKEVGPYFSSSDLVGKIPEVMWQVQQKNSPKDGN